MNRDLLSRTVRILIYILVIVFFIFPFYIVVINAFKTGEAVLLDPLTFKFQNLTLDNLVKVATSSSFNIFQAYGTTIIITGTSILFILFFCSMASYVIARTDNRFMTFIYIFFLCGIMIPPQVTLIPLIQLLTKINLMNTFMGLILHNIASYTAFSIFIYTGFIRSISHQLDESAKLDGANSFTIFWRIIFPLLRPATGTIFIFLFMWIWNDFISPQIILGTKYETITTGVYNAIGQYNTNWNEVFSYIIYSSLPIFVLYLFMQRYFIEGLTEGSIKG